MGNNPTLFESARVTQVFFQQGSFGKGDPKLYQAPFELVLNSEGLFLQPASMGDLSKYQLTNNAGDSAWIQARKNIGWIQAQKPVIINEHEMGDFLGHPNDWKGCHSFGLI